MRVSDVHFLALLSWNATNLPAAAAMRIRIYPLNKPLLKIARLCLEIL